MVDKVLHQHFWVIPRERYADPPPHLFKKGPKPKRCVMFENMFYFSGEYIFFPRNVLKRMQKNVDQNWRKKLY